MKTTIIGAMLLALVACASSGENTRAKVGAVSPAPSLAGPRATCSTSRPRS